MINFYRDMWAKRSEIFGPLHKLTSKNVKFQWTEECQKAFKNMKIKLSKETLLAYPDFEQEFQIHTDASHTQLGALISQKGQPIAFYLRKLNDAQTRYTTTKRKLLAIVKTLKEFKNNLLGQKIRIYTDHKNLTYNNFNTERVMRWQLLLEECGPTLDYIKGYNNIVADALSRLEIEEKQIDEIQMAETFGMEKIPTKTYPLNYKTIHKYQQADAKLVNEQKANPSFTLQWGRWKIQIDLQK